MTKVEALQKLEFERKWLSDAGYNAYNVDIAFDSIRTIIKVLCGDEPILDKIRDEIEIYEADCRLQGGTDECERCNSNVFESIYRIIDKYKAESEDNK